VALPKDGAVTKSAVSGIHFSAYIKEVWTDMRPFSLRKKMQEQGLS
jgi:uncharacterized protein YbdZ (MbtH family)